MAKKLGRGISQEFAKEFKKTDLYNLYQENKDELIIGVRNNSLNLYYNCDSIAKITFPYKKKFNCNISNFFLEGNKRKDKKTLTLTPNEIKSNYGKIKKNSNDRSTPEKKAQSKLFILNNQNEDSKWYCIDVEYVKQFKNIQQRTNAGFQARFDFITISKEAPHRIALIELKYGRKAIGGNSGIYKHVKDFSKFKENEFFNPLFTQEIIEIIQSLKDLYIIDLDNIPIQQDFLTPEFYFITLDNNKEKTKGSTPKQSMAGYLFEEKRWGCTRLTTKDSVEKHFGDITKKDNPFNATFLFSSQTLSNLTIDDIIDGDYDERIEPM